MDFIIDPEFHDKTVLSFLKSTLKISSSSLAALKRDEKGITVNGKHVTVRYILKPGDVLSVNEKDSPSDVNELLLPVNIDIDVIFENNDYSYK